LDLKVLRANGNLIMIPTQMSRNRRSDLDFSTTLADRLNQRRAESGSTTSSVARLHFGAKLVCAELDAYQYDLFIWIFSDQKAVHP